MAKPLTRDEVITLYLDSYKEPDNVFPEVCVALGIEPGKKKFTEQDQVAIANAIHWMSTEEVPDYGVLKKLYGERKDKLDAGLLKSDDKEVASAIQTIDPRALLVQVAEDGYNQGLEIGKGTNDFPKQVQEVQQTAIVIGIQKGMEEAKKEAKGGKSVALFTIPVEDIKQILDDLKKS